MIALSKIPADQIISVSEVGYFLREMNYCFSAEVFLSQHVARPYVSFAALQEWFEGFFPQEDSQFLLRWFWQSHQS
jgi:hypothetical protein